MARLKLVPNPTFYSKVQFTAHGEEVVEITFKFKHRTRDQYNAWITAEGDKANVDAILEVAEGWDLEEPFTRENVALLDQNYMGAPLAIFEKYVDEMRGSKEKN